MITRTDPLWAIHARYFYLKSIPRPKDGFLRDPGAGRVIAYCTREAAEAAAAEMEDYSEDKYGHRTYLLHYGEMDPPSYKVRRASPRMRVRVAG
jgi:hypothetical protein